MNHLGGERGSKTAEDGVMKTAYHRDDEIRFMN